MNNRILVDGQNILRHGDSTVKPENLKILHSWAKENKVELLIVLPSYREYKEKILPEKDIYFVNHRIPDDSVLIQLATQYNLPILSNDRFRDYREKFPEYDFKNNVFSFDIILGVLVTDLIDFLRKLHTSEKKVSTSTC